MVAKEKETEVACLEGDQLPSVSPLVKKYGVGRGKSGVGIVWRFFGEESWEVEVVNPGKEVLTDDEEAS